MFQTGHKVVVSDPKHFDSPHSQSFKGEIVGKQAFYYLVKDQEGNIWTIEPDEIGFDMSDLAHDSGDDNVGGGCCMPCRKACG